MDTIIFTCSECDQSLEAPAAMVGHGVKCPTCGQAIRIMLPQSAEHKRDSTATVPINTAALGGLPPKPLPRRVVVKRATGK
jgi:DNA-directed RNA polymerase subunit RPC12/RpoP